MHPEALSSADDIRVAVAKVEAGATFLVTQFFFDNDVYFQLRRASASGRRDGPYLPGIMPITSYDAIGRMTQMSGARIPQRLLAELEARIDEPAAVLELGVAFCAVQCRELLARGAPGLHFYTLNKSTATRAVVSALIAANAVHELMTSDR